MAAKRRIVVRRDDSLCQRRVSVKPGDILILNGFEIDADVLLEITRPNRRMLWSFVQSEDGARIQPTPFTEDKVIWIEASDLVRAKEDI